MNAATFAAGPIAPGSIATISGTNFAGTNVTVTFDGNPGQVLFSNGTQINVVVPAALGAKASTQVAVSVDGNSSAPFTATLAPFAPGIFANGILNQDYSLNNAQHPAAVGSVIQIFATGLSGNGVITAKIGGMVVDQPYYAGPAPGLVGVQQVDLILPQDLTRSHRASVDLRRNVHVPAGLQSSRRGGALAVTSSYATIRSRGESKLGDIRAGAGDNEYGCLIMTPCWCCLSVGRRSRMT